jgi:RNA polymerase sigma factor (sigma-70 family)
MVGSSRSRRQPAPEDPAHQPDRLSESTRSLLHRAKVGDSSALDEICARYLPRLSRWAEGRLPLRARGLVDTGDLVQESLIGALGRLGGLRARYPEAFPTYLRTAILNRIRNEVRRTARNPEVAALKGTEADPSASPLEVLIGAELAQRYEEALALLRDEDRAVLFLKIEMDMSPAEIAEALDKPSPDAARKAINRALIRLAEEMTVECG